MANRRLRVALIGQGFMGRAHSNAYAQAGHFFELPFEIERKVVCGRDRARLQRMAATWGWQEIETDWRAAVERSDIDVVDVAAPNALHAPISIAAAEAGKIVFSEKPLAMSAAEGARMAAAARGRPSLVWFNYRRVPAIAFARRLVEEGRIGQVFHYRATYLQEWGNDPTRPPNWKMEKAQAGSGVIGDLLCHLVDTALFLNGGIREVTALATTFAAGREIDDACALLARFENGSVGTFEASRFAVGAKNRNAFEIHGSRGMLRFNLEDLNRLEYFDATERRDLQGGRNLLVAAEPYWKPGHIVGYEHTFISALAEFLQALARGEPFHPNFEDGQQVQLVLEAVERSAQSGQWTRPEAQAAALE